MTSLVFRMDLPSSASETLVPGKLFVLDNTGAIIDTYNSTSGARSHQHKNAQNQRALGPVPECTKVGISSYSVPTRGFLSHLAGVGGNFYHMTPDPVNIQGTTRGEFGIHRDANFATSPGSAGCIVMRDGEFQRFERLMRNLRTQQNLSKLSLLVEYNRTTPVGRPPISSPVGSHFTVTQPKPLEILDINRPVTFIGTAKPEVSTIIVLIGPGGPFKIADLKNVGASWSFSQKFVTKGVNRPVRFRAFDAEGNHLEDIRLAITLQ